MVHRSTDSRLIANLISQEKDYSKHIQALLNASQLSINSLLAFGSASPPPTSTVILAVAGSLATADEALRQYAASVEHWRVYLQDLKTLEDEVGNIMRDREILVTRLLKASKSTEKQSATRLPARPLSSPPYPDSSTVSLSSEDVPISTSYTLSPAYNQSAFPGPVNKKLQSAQAELQACEACLASKERELQAKRLATVREGLNMRCQGLVECGKLWADISVDIANILDENASAPLSNANLLLASKPLSDPSGVEHTSSDLSSIAPSQSASQVNLVNSSPEATAQLSPNSSTSSPKPAEPDHSQTAFTRHVLPHRITEEDLGFRPGSLGAAEQKAESSEEGDSTPDMRVIENPRFNQAAAPASKTKLMTRNTESPSKKDRKPSLDQGSGSSKIFGSIRGLFSRQSKTSHSDRDSIDDDDSLRKAKKKGMGWEMRTHRNISRSAPAHDPKPSSPLNATVNPESLAGGNKRLRKGRGIAAANGIRDEVLQMRRRSRSLDSHIKELGVAGDARDKEERTWGSETEGEGLERKKSSRSKASSSSPPGMMHNKLHSSLVDTGSGSTLSRNSSLLSAASAPANLNAPRRRTTTIANVPSHSASQNALVTPLSKHKSGHTKAERRASSPANGMHDPGTSLMSIVEDVSRANREGWNPANRGPVTGMIKSSGGTIQSHKRSSSMGGSRASLDLPKAPRSVFNADSTQTMDSLPIVTANADTSRTSRPTSRPVKTPLRSALRNPSRSPSPMLPKEPKEVEGLPSTSNASPFSSSTKDDRNNADTASISSYETGHETLEDDAHDANDDRHSSTSTETPVPPPPPAKTPQRRKSVRVSLQPSFSTTPPAIEYSEDERWNGSWTRSRNAAHDVWEDSSEEDAEYQKARTLLSRASKKT